MTIDDHLRTRLSLWVHCEHWWFREFFAEFLGTAFLIALGDGAVAQVVLSKEARGTFLTINLAFSLAIAFGVYISGGISGGHINPAMTLAMCLLGKTKWKQLPVYWLAQYTGAFFGSLVLFVVYHDAIANFDGGTREVYGPNATAGIFATYPQEYVSTTTGFFDQLIGTAILSMCVLALTDPKNMTVPKHLVPLLVGLTVGLVGMSYGMNCGFAINPARDFGPRLFTAVSGWGFEVFSYRNFNWFWVPIVSPHMGAIVGAFLYEIMIGLHWPYVVERKVTNGHSIGVSNTEQDFNMGQLTLQKNNASNSNVNNNSGNPAYGMNNAMRMYVS